MKAKLKILSNMKQGGHITVKFLPSAWRSFAGFITAFPAFPVLISSSAENINKKHEENAYQSKKLLRGIALCLSIPTIVWA